MKRDFHFRVLFFLVVLWFCSVTFAQYGSFFTHIPSDVGGDLGIALWIKSPVAARYPEGAPIAIYMTGGFDGEGIGDKEANLIEKGFVEISFNFQGSGVGDKQSGGGPYDFRGPESLIAVRDVIRFALGLIRDQTERSLTDIVAPIVPLSTNVGIIGYSNGGNTNICVAGIHGEDIAEMAWILNWESPVGDGMPQAEAGSKECDLRPLNPLTNPAYDPDTGDWDLSALAYDPQIRIPVLDDINIVVIGGVYFDFDGDAMFDRGSDFIPYPLVFEVGGAYKSYYSVRIRSHAEQADLIHTPPPSHLTTAQETASFWDVRNGEYWISQATDKLPNLMFMVVGSEIDHVQRSPDHPHILLQYESFRSSNARFVRVNPDRRYVEYILGHPAPEAVDNDAFAPLDHFSIRNAVEPGSYEDELGRDTIVPAAACELADRTYYNDVSVQLDEIITSVDESVRTPDDFQVYPNYPNPFNPCTFIPFRVKQLCRVKLDVFNCQGQKISTLVDALIGPGDYRIKFDAGDQAAGVYHYRIRMGDVQFMRKMTLVK